MEQPTIRTTDVSAYLEPEPVAGEIKLVLDLADNSSFGVVLRTDDLGLSFCKNLPYLLRDGKFQVTRRADNKVIISFSISNVNAHTQTWCFTCDHLAHNERASCGGTSGEVTRGMNVLTTHCTASVSEYQWLEKLSDLEHMCGQFTDYSVYTFIKAVLRSGAQGRPIIFPALGHGRIWTNHLAAGRATRIPQCLPCVVGVAAFDTPSSLEMGTSPVIIPRIDCKRLILTTPLASLGKIDVHENVCELIISEGPSVPIASCGPPKIEVRTNPQSSASEDIETCLTRSQIHAIATLRKKFRGKIIFASSRKEVINFAKTHDYPVIPPISPNDPFNMDNDSIAADIVVADLSVLGLTLPDAPADPIPIIVSSSDLAPPEHDVKPVSVHSLAEYDIDDFQAWCLQDESLSTRASRSVRSMVRT